MIPMSLSINFPTCTNAFFVSIKQTKAYEMHSTVLGNLTRAQMEASVMPLPTQLVARVSLCWWPQDGARQQGYWQWKNFA